MMVMAAANTNLPAPYDDSPELIDVLIPPGSILTRETNRICNERIICIGDRSIRKRRRSEGIIGDDCNCENRSAYAIDDNKHAFCWDAFQPYLDKCIPVKINDVASFRHADGTSNEPVFSTMSVDSLPSDVLDKSITVQCVPNIDCENLHPAEMEENKIRQQARAIDAKLSVLSNTDIGQEEGRSIPTFMGQEDQVTTCMPLRELLSVDKHSHHVSASQLPILDVDEVEQDSISIDVNGKLRHEPTSNLELSPLASLLRLPSYLLLGHPHNKSKDIVIQSINLWHAPQSCCTNVHYDEHDNLLIVTNGVKVVELCPPGCIQASEVYSAHANHPKLLRRSGNIQIDESIQQDIKSTLERKTGRTQIVTVAAGEALYIPLGWWHRVISKCDQNDANGVACTAINVWFDRSRQSNLPEHMTVFQLRQSSRRYFLLNKDHAAKSLLEEKKREFFLKHDFPKYLSEHTSNTDEDDISRHWRDLNVTVFKKDELDKSSILTFGMIYCKCLLCTDHFLLEGFLLRIDLENASHVAGLVNMWSSLGNHTMRFSEILLQLSPESCYILTQAWERHATFLDESGDTQDEAEVSYQQFFLMLGEHSNKVRNHLLNSVEEFYRQVWVKICEI